MKANEIRVKKMCELAGRLLEQDSDGRCINPRTLPADAQAEIRRVGQLLGLLLQKIDDDRMRWR